MEVFVLDAREFMKNVTGIPEANKFSQYHDDDEENVGTKYSLPHYDDEQLLQMRKMRRLRHQQHEVISLAQQKDVGFEIETSTLDEEEMSIADLQKAMKQEKEE